MPDVIFDAALLKRIECAERCTDTADLDRVENAGEVVERGGSFFQIMHNGVLALKDGYCGPWMTELIRRLNGVHEPQEERVFHELMRKMRDGAAMIELGAYWSDYSLWFRRTFPSARSILVEPDPANLAVGRTNFAANQVEGEFLQACVASEYKSAVEFPCESDGATRKIPAVSVDWLLDHYHLDRVDVLLADIQGAETAMLDGMRKAVAECRVRVVFLSTHDFAISGDYLTHDKCLEKLKAWGAHIVAEHTVEESYTGDGLIVASFDPGLRFTVEISHNRAENSLFGSSAPRLARLDARCRELQRADSSLEHHAFFTKLSERIARQKPRGLGLKDAFRVRRWRRYWEDRRQEKKCSEALRQLRLRGRTETLLGRHALYEVLRDDDIIAPRLKTELAWQYDGLIRAVNLVKRETGRSLRHATLLDIGSNIGLIGLQALGAELIQSVIAIEPDPVNFALLWNNVATNGWHDRFFLLETALGTTDGVCELEIAEKNPGDHRVRTSHPPTRGDDRFGEASRKTIRVPIHRLDTVINQFPGELKRQVGLCWIDVRGFEWKVVEGGLNAFLTSRWPTVMGFWPYGMKRAGTTSGNVQNLAERIWTRFMDLSAPADQWRPVSDLSACWNELEGAEFANLLFL